jgi:methylthioribose-1-phosphate isomerase
MSSISPIAWADRAIRILDQTRLPDDEVYLDLATVEQVVEAIRALRVRGAPLIGITAAMGLAVVAQRQAERMELTAEWLAGVADTLEASRPTAVDLHWALDRMRRLAGEKFAGPQSGLDVSGALRDEAQRRAELHDPHALQYGCTRDRRARHGTRRDLRRARAGERD